MLIEDLEKRIVLSHMLVGGVLTVTGTNGNDNISLNLSGNQVKLSDDGHISIIPLASITSIQIDAGNGNDKIISDDAIKVPTTLMGGPGNDSLRAGGGDDFLSGAGGNDTMDGGLGADTMFGGSGTDTVTYASRTADLTITIDDNGNDGEAGERDDVGSGVENVIGGSGNDSIVGSAGNNSITGGDGNDTIFGAAGNDTIDGGLGADSMSGGPGLDTITYASRTASVTVELGSSNNGQAGENDTLGTDFETLIGGSGNDTMFNTGQNIVVAQTLPDLLIEGGPGNDGLQGGFGNDTLLGGPGDDDLGHDPGNDVIDGGTGVNTYGLADVLESGGARLTLDGVANDGFADENDNVTNVEIIYGSNGDDTLIGDDRNDTIDGFLGNDSIQGGGGNDLLETSGGGTLIGGAGNDTLTGGNLSIDTFITDMEGGPGDDQLFPDQVTQTLTGDSGNDVVMLGAIHFNRTFDFSNSSFETIIGSRANDSIIGGPGNEVILGEGGDDTIEGNGGDDYIDGGPGRDSLDGGSGDDIFVNQSGPDQQPGPDIDTVNGGDGIDFAQDDGGQDLLTGVEFLYDPQEGLPAQPLSVKEVAAIATPAIDGGGSLSGGVLTIGGENSSTGAPMPDSISVILDSTGKNISVTEDGVSKSYPLASVKSISIDSGGGNDSIALAKSDGSRAIPIPVSVLGGAGNDTITGGGNNDSLFGGDGNDSIHGGNGNDSIEGGIGNDTLNGDEGNDILNGGTEVLGQNSDGADNISGGAGNDSVLYSFRTDDLNIDISSGKKANDGAPGEGDNVNSDIENVFSGDGDDSIVGNAAANVISGGGGNDTVDAGDGNDKLIGSRGDDTLRGQGGINLYSVADGARDDIDVALDSSGHPVKSFVSADPKLDFSTIAGTVIS